MNQRKLEALRASRRDSVTRQKTADDYCNYRRGRVAAFSARLHPKSRNAKKKYI